MSLSTLKKRLKTYGLKRRNAQYDIESVRKTIENLLYGRCMVLSSTNGARVPRTVVQLLLRELDPEGTNESKHTAQIEAKDWS